MARRRAGTRFDTRAVPTPCDRWKTGNRAQPGHGFREADEPRFGEIRQIPALPALPAETIAGPARRL